MSFFTNTQTDLLAILAADGEALIYNDRDGGADVNFISVMHRNGDDGSAIINIPVADVTAPLFGDKITDGNADIWYIMDQRETLQGRTFCDLKHAEYWHSVSIQEKTGGSWGDHTTGLIAMITSNSSFEDFDEYNTQTTEYTVRMRYLSDPTQRMRIVFGTKHLYITGIRQDPTFSKWSEFDCREDEA